LAKGRIAAVLAILIVGGMAGYFFYHDYAQGTVTLSISDPPQLQNANSPHYNSSILHIYVTFTEIDIHQAGFGTTNSTGWYAVVKSSTTVDMISVLNTPRVLASTNLATGLYDQLRFPVSKAIVTFSTIGNVSYTIPSSSLKVSITGGGLQSSPGIRVNLQLTISFSDTEILAMTGYLTPHATAQIVG
jgi:uncharacterized protein DUF4382